MPEISWDKQQQPAEIVRVLASHTIFFDKDMIIDFQFVDQIGKEHGHVAYGGYACTCGEGGWYDYEIGLQCAFEHLVDVAEELLK